MSVTGGKADWADSVDLLDVLDVQLEFRWDWFLDPGTDR